METKKRDEELTEEQLEKVQGGVRMARSGGDLESVGTFPWYHGNLGGDIVDSPTPGQPSVGEPIPMDDPDHHLP